MIGPLQVAVVGSGTAGAAAATLLAREGHQVEVFERVSDPQPVGAGIMLQPTGMSVLNRLGVLQEILTLGARVDRLVGTTVKGRRILDMSYSDYDPRFFGLGLHRGALFSSLYGLLKPEGVQVTTGVEITTIKNLGNGRGSILTSGQLQDYGPYHLVICADGGRSNLRTQAVSRSRRSSYRWGALWAMVEDPENSFNSQLTQFYRGTKGMVGFLPTGRPAPASENFTSLFWSMPVKGLERLRAFGLDGWKASVLELAPGVENLLDRVTHFDQLTLASYYHVSMPYWHGDGVVLLGDAGHAMSPQLGQGANIALIDAAVLTDAIAVSESLGQALELYSLSRKHHLQFYGLATRLMTPLFQSGAEFLTPPRDLVFSLLTQRKLTRRLMAASMVGGQTGLLGHLPMQMIEGYLGENV